MNENELSATREHRLDNAGAKFFSFRRIAALGMRSLVIGTGWLSVVSLALVLIFAGCSKKTQSTGPSSAEINATQNSDSSEAETTRPEGSEDADSALSISDAAASESGPDTALASGGEKSEAADSLANSGVPAHWKDASWTQKRLVALAASGPVVLDLRISVGGQSLAEASEEMAASIWEELFVSAESEKESEAANVEAADEGKPVPELNWEDLLEHPIVQSGWLGNLVPDDEQEDQIFSMYDEGQDREVTLAEFQNFLSRGLSRRSALQVTDGGAEDGADSQESPWGDIDQNQDYAIDGEEGASVPKAVAKYDLNGDSIVSLQELNQPNSAGQANMGMRYSSMLDVNTLYIADGLFDDDPDERLDEEKALARKILEHYTFLEGIERAQWSSWSDERWDELDANEDGLLNRSELRAMSKQDPECRLAIYLPPAQAMVKVEGSNSEGSMASSTMGPDAMATTGMEVLALTPAEKDGEQLSPAWLSVAEGGRLSLNGFVLQLDVEDVYGTANANLLRQRLEMALTNEQFASFASSQLQLQEDAFDLIDEDDDDKLSDAEFHRVWRWLTVRQSARALGRWMTVKHPWFQLLDLSGDKKLSQKELADAAATISMLDSDSDGSVAPNEMPLLVRFEITRTDSRLDFGGLGLPQTNEADMPADWFAAMDTNQDGFLSKLEFLGEIDDFSALDADNDGFIARKEVY
ncbi:MAG: hypothetical protein AAGG44_11610 [Planctomycetota bacterium]